MKLTCLLLAGVVILGATCACHKKAEPSSEASAPPADALARENVTPQSLLFRKDASLTVTSAGGDSLRASFDVEIAATRESNLQGLMWRESMEPNQGMLFDPQGISDNSFWMKNTIIPLDILFIDADRQIVFIAENTKPFSEDRIDPQTIYRYTLELNAGTCYKHKIKIGDTVKWNSDPH